MAARLGVAALRRVLKVQREAYLAELASLGELQAHHRERPLIQLLIDAALLHTRASLEVVELAEARADGIANSEKAEARGQEIRSTTQQLGA